MSTSIFTDAGISFTCGIDIFGGSIFTGEIVGCSGGRTGDNTGVIILGGGTIADGIGLNGFTCGGLTTTGVIGIGKILDILLFSSNW